MKINFPSITHVVKEVRKNLLYSKNVADMIPQFRNCKNLG